MEKWDRDHPQKAALKQDIARGIAQLDRGNGIPGDAVLRELAAKTKRSRVTKKPRLTTL